MSGKPYGQYPHWPLHLPRVNTETLQQLEEYLAQWASLNGTAQTQLQSLQDWAGAAANPLQLAELISQPLPETIQQAAQRRQAWQTQQAAISTEQAARELQRAALLQRLQQVRVDTEDRQQSAGSHTRDLTQLLLPAQQLLTLQTELARARARQSEQRSRGLASLWNALSGQAAALQRDIDRLQESLTNTQASYHLKATSLNLLPVPRPEDLEQLIASDRQQEQALQEELESAQQELSAQLDRLEEERQSQATQLQQLAEQAAAAWQTAQQHYPLPEWPLWAELWSRREQGQQLHQELIHSREQQAALMAHFEQVWRGWPEPWRELETLIDRLPELKQALNDEHLWQQEELARQVAAAQEREVAQLEQSAQETGTSTAAWSLDDLQTAERLLQSHVAAAGEAAMCSEALSEWAGVAQNPLGLAALVSAPLPADLLQAMQEPAPSWPTVARTYGLPEEFRSWERLWLNRAKAQRLWQQWQTAQERRLKTEEQMAAMWAAWPSSDQALSGFREEVELARQRLAVSPVPSQDLVVPPLPAVIPQEAVADLTVREELQDSPELQLSPQQRTVAEDLLQQFETLSESVASRRSELRSMSETADPVKIMQLLDGPMPAAAKAAWHQWLHARQQAVNLDERKQDVTQAIALAQQQAAEQLGPLRQLRPLADELTVAQRRSARLDDPAAQRHLAQLEAAYLRKVQALQLYPIPAADQVRRMIEQHEQAFQQALQPQQQLWRQRTERQRALDLATAEWRSVSRQYGYPRQPETWQKLRHNAAEVQAVCKLLEWERENLSRVSGTLEEFWSRWPVSDRNLEGLRRALEQSEVRSPELPVPEPALPVQPPAAERTTPLLPQPGEASIRPEQDAEARWPDAELPPPPPPTLTSLEGEMPASPLSLQPPAPPLPASFLPAPGTLAVPEVTSAAAPQEAVLPSAVPLPLAEPSADDEAQELLTLSDPLPLPHSAPPAVEFPAPAPLPPLPGLPTPPSGVTAPVPVLPVPPLPITSRTVPHPEQGGTLLSPGRLSRRERAEREAIRITYEYDWQRGFELLADTFDRDNWGQLRSSIEREIAAGMTPEEFELMLQLRAWWHEQLHFRAPYSARYDSLPWSLGLAVIRRSTGLPCLDELTLLLDRLYDFSEQYCSRRHNPAFAQRLGIILNDADPDMELDLWLSLQEGL